MSTKLQPCFFKIVINVEQKKEISFMKYIFTLVLFILIKVSFAQEVVNQFGVRAGGGNGFSYKYIEDLHLGFEGIAGYRDRGFQLTGLIEQYKPIMTDRISNLMFFTGFGAHAGYIREKETFCVYQNNACVQYEDKKNYVVAGFDGIVGFEYHFHTVPIGASVDYKPYLEFFGPDFFRIDLWNFALSVRYKF